MTRSFLRVSAAAGGLAVAALMFSAPADAAAARPAEPAAAAAAAAHGTIRILWTRTTRSQADSPAAVTCKKAEASAQLEWGKSPHEVFASFTSEVSWCYNSTIVTSSGATYSGGTTSKGDLFKWDYFGLADNFSKSCYVSEGSAFKCSGNTISQGGQFAQCPGDVENGSCDTFWIPSIDWRVAWKGFVSVKLLPAAVTETTTIVTNG